jgi:hypothetical protein
MFDTASINDERKRIAVLADLRDADLDRRNRVE